MYIYIYIYIYNTTKYTYKHIYNRFATSPLRHEMNGA